MSFISSHETPGTRDLQTVDLLDSSKNLGVLKPRVRISKTKTFIYTPSISTHRGQRTQQPDCKLKKPTDNGVTV